MSGPTTPSGAPQNTGSLNGLQARCQSTRMDPTPSSSTGNITIDISTCCRTAEWAAANMAPSNSGSAWQHATQED
eukprot:9500908-Pyramimonas_sp.AAC.1